MIDNNYYKNKLKSFKIFNKKLVILWDEGGISINPNFNIFITETGNKHAWDNGWIEHFIKLTEDYCKDYYLNKIPNIINYIKMNDKEFELKLESWNNIYKR